MVRGLDIWKEYFADYSDSYVLIGGAACSMYEEEYAQRPRATKDLDLILVVEALSPAFGTKIWEFIKDGNYGSRQKGNKGHEYYRFMNPGNKSFPQQIELFCRRLNVLTIPENARLEQIHIDEDLSSLSAIIMDDDYYNFTIAHSTLFEGIHLANIESLICLKAKAYIDLEERKQEGVVIDSRNLEKHKKDIMCLAAMIPGNAKYDLPAEIKKHISEFVHSVKDNLPNADFMKSVGLAMAKPEDLLQTIVASFI